MKTNNSIHCRVLAVTAILTAFVWCMACSFYSTTMDSCASISVRWKNGGVSPSALVRQQNNAKKDGIADQPEVTLWQVYSAQQIMDSDMRNTTANVVAVFGECEDITTKSMLYCAFPSNSDTQGCAVSSGLAFSLWGSTQVLGVQVRIEGEVFYVRGVFEDDNARVFRQAEFDKTLSNMQLTFPGGGTREDAERYLTAANFMGGTILDLPLMGRGFRILFRFPAIVLAFGIIVRLLRRARKLWHYQAWLFSYLPFVLAVLAVLMLCIDLPEIPSSFIPSKWSDFEFWKDLFLSHWKNVTRWTSAAPTFRDKELWGSASAMLLLSIFATILVAVSAAMTSIRSYKNMVLTCAAYILTLCLISLGTVSSGKQSFCKEMYLVPCLWIGIDYMLYWQGRRFDLASHERRLSDDKNTSKATEETVEQT